MLNCPNFQRSCGHYPKFGTRTTDMFSLSDPFRVTQKKTGAQFKDFFQFPISTSDMQAIVDNLKNDHIGDSTKENYHAIWMSSNRFFLHLDVKPHNWEDRIVLFVGFLIQEGRQSQTICSYLSAIKAVLLSIGVKLKQDQFLLSSLARACKLKNDKINTKLPIQKSLLQVIIRRTKQHFGDIGQIYLQSLYCALFSTAYFGLFRVGELSSGSRPV